MSQKIDLTTCTPERRRQIERARIADRKCYYAHHAENRARTNERRKANGRANDNRDPEKAKACQARYMSKPENQTKLAYRSWWISSEGVAYAKSRGPSFRVDLAHHLQKRLLSTKRRVAREGNKVEFDDAVFAAVLKMTPPTICEGCGGLLDYKWKKSGGYHSPAVSVDRIDNTGYVVGKIGFICARCNAIKADATAKELRQIAAYIDRHCKRSNRKRDQK